VLIKIWVWFCTAPTAPPKRNTETFACFAALSLGGLGLGKLAGN